MIEKPPKKVVDMKVVRPTGPQAPRLNQKPGVDDLSSEQKRYALRYQDRSRRMIEKIGRVFIGPKAPITAAAQKMDDLTKEIEHYMMVKTKKSLNLEEFVLLFGSLAGLQAGLSAAFGKKGLSSQDYHDAGQLFEAGMRAVAKTTEAYARKMRVQPPPPPRTVKR